jgi:hypothetical protein
MRYISILLVLLLPSVVFSADESGGASRSSGVAPLAISFNAALTEGSTNFTDYKYVWDFGDTASGSWGTNSKSKNEAFGPVAAHVYETVGNYTATLTVTDPSTGEEVTALALSIPISVTNPDTVFSGTNTICISDTANSDFTDCPDFADTESVDTLTNSNLSTWMSSGHRVLFHRGSSFTFAGETRGYQVINTLRVGAYGTCDSPDDSGVCENAPVITVTDTDSDTSTLSTFVNLNYSDDVVIQDLSFVAEREVTAPITATVGYSNIVSLRIKVRGFVWGVDLNHSLNSTYPNAPKGIYVISNDIKNTGMHNLYLGAEDLAVVGNTLRDSLGYIDQVGLYGGHITRVWWSYKGVYQHNLVSGANINGTRGNANLKFHGPKLDTQVGTYAETGAGGLPESTRYSVISDNRFGGSGSFCVAIKPQNDASNEEIHDLIFERNLLQADYGTTGKNVWFQGLILYGYNIVVRNNVWDATDPLNNLPAFYGVSVGAYDIQTPASDITVYNNTIYSSGNSLGGNAVGVWVDDNVTSVDIKNNLVMFADATGTIEAVRDDSGIATYSNNVNTSTDTLSNSTLDDYTLTTLSTDSIDAGLTVYSVFEDFVNNVRAGVYDVGAYEYGSAPYDPVDEEDEEEEVIPTISSSGAVYGAGYSQFGAGYMILQED